MKLNILNTKRKVLVTGGAGYGGSHTVVALAQAGYTPVIVDNFINADKRVLQGLRALMDKPLSIYEGDCCNYKFIDHVFNKEESIFAVIHFAAHKSVDESLRMPLMYYSNNVGSLTCTLNAMAKRNIRYFVFSSSCTVYGKPRKIPVEETLPFEKPESPYGHSKQIGEQIIKASVESGIGLKAVSLRYFNIIGAHPSGLIGECPIREKKNFVPLMMESAVRGKKKLIVTGKDHKTQDGTCIRDYTHVLDIADAHVRALDYLSRQKRNEFHDAINLGTGRGYSVMEMIEKFQKVTGRKVPYIIGSHRAGDIDAIYANVSKARSALGWKASWNIEDGLKHAWAWQKNMLN